MFTCTFLIVAMLSGAAAVYFMIGALREPQFSWTLRLAASGAILLGWLGLAVNHTVAHVALGGPPGPALDTLYAALALYAFGGALLNRTLYALKRRAAFRHWVAITSLGAACGALVVALIIVSGGTGT